MGLRLIVRSPGRWHGAAIPVTPFPFVIGKAPDCHLRTTGLSAGDRHCALLTRAGRFFVHPLQRERHTLLNGAEVHQASALATGDSLHIGSFHFEILVDDAALPDPAGGGLFSSAGDATNPDEAAAKFLLSLPDELRPAEAPPPPRPEAAGHATPAPKPAREKPKPKPTSEAAEDLIRKHLRLPERKP